MPRPRKPTKVLELNGAFKHNPKRALERQNEPEVTDPLGDPPDCLAEDEKARWYDLAEQGPWLTLADRAIVEQTARLWAAERKGRTSAGQQKLFSQNLGSLGLRASDRSKIQVPGKRKTANRFQGLA